MTSTDVSEQLLLQIAELSTWLSSLSLAVVGGIVAGFLQIAFHNASKPNNQVELRLGYLLIVALFVEATAVLAGYITRASLLTKISYFQDLSLSENVELGRQSLGFLSFTQYSSVFQFILFIVGVFMVGIFVLANQHLLKAQKSNICEESEK